MKQRLLKFKYLKIGAEFMHDGVRLRKTSALQYVRLRGTDKLLLAPNAERVDTGASVHIDTDLEVERADR